MGLVSANGPRRESRTRDIPRVFVFGGRIPVAPVVIVVKVVAVVDGRVPRQPLLQRAFGARKKCGGGSEGCSCCCCWV